MRHKKGDMMALFLRVFISLFLFSTIAHSETMGGTNSYKYYKTRYETPARCSTDHQSMCSSMPSVFNASSSCGAETKTCGQYMGTTLSTRQCTGQTPYGSYTYQDMFESAGQFDESTVTCPAGESLVMNGCVATCENVCQQRKDTIESLSVQCGSFQCPSGSKTVIYGGKIVCDKSPGSFSQSAVGASAIKDSCELQAQALPDSFDINDARGLNSELGGQSQAGFCSVEYKYTGQKTTSPDTPTQEGGMGFNVSYLPRNPDGSCPTTHPTTGTFNGENICVADSAPPDDGAGACPTGQTRNTSGVCAPSNGTGGDGDGDAVCATGQVKNASGVCVAAGSGEGGDSEGCPLGQVKNAAGVCGAPSVGGSSGTCTNGTGGCSANTTTECRTAPTCTGDPINCAILLQSWKNACLLIASPTVEQQGDVTKSMTETDTALSGIKSTFQASLDSAMSTLPSSIPTSAACISDSAFRVLSLTIPIPLSKLCPYFQTMRSMLLLVAYLFAARIIFGSIGSSGGVRV